MGSLSRRLRLQCVFQCALCMIFLSHVSLYAQTVQVGAGSYTTAQPPGTVSPPPTIFRTFSGPVPTHTFWTAKNWFPQNIITFNGGPFVMFPQPLTMQTTPSGLLLGYFANGVLNNGTFFNDPFEGDLTLGVAGLNAPVVNSSSFSDWTVDFNFGPITTRVGRGMPFVYATTNGSNPTVTFAGPPTVFANNGNVLGITIAGNNYGLFCPTGGTWSGIGGTVLTCNLPAGRDYFSLALLPNSSALGTYAAVAFSFPTNTQAVWSYNENTSQVTTTYTVTTQAMEGGQTGFLMALYPHHYTSMQGSINTNFSYASTRGPLKVLSGTSFTTVDTYHGVIPYLPATNGIVASQLQPLLDAVAAEPNHFTANDTYNLGKQLARIAHLMPVAQSVGATNDLNNFQTSIETKMGDWFTAQGKTTDLFFYNRNWSTLIGYPAAFGSDTQLNDHHFHYGYWIHSSAIINLFDPTWLSSSRFGGMVDLLAGDIATPVRNSSMFPFLRHFDIYAGHSWASGQAPFGDGQNEESSSEAVNAETGLILLASQTGNTQLRDAAIWLYTLETNSVFDYWFNDGPVPTFPAGFTRTAVANVFDGKADTATFFGAQPEFEHGIEFLPFHGGSFYLGRDPAYSQRNFNEILSLDPALANWPDLMTEYEAFFNPTDAINRWNATTFTFDGESRAHEYYWLHNIAVLGNVDETVTANTPLYAVFRNPSTGVRTHIAFNATASAIAVTFSDGKVLSVPPNTLATDNGVPVNRPSAALSPGSLAFGGQNLGTTSAPQTLRLTNNGPGALTISAVTASGDFAQSNNCGTSLAATASCTINITFTPTAVGVRTGTLTVTGNASNSPQTASLSGTGNGGGGTISFGSGFTAANLSLNGGATINGTRLRLTDGGTGEARSAFFISPVSVLSFTSDFSFQLTNPSADGFTFTIQGNNPRIVGPSGGSLAYGGAGGIPKSIAVKFDLFNNAGEGVDSTGLYTNGVLPTTPSVDMTASGVNLHSGHVFNVHMSYDGSRLAWTIVDASTAQSFSTSAAVNIPSLVGASTAFFGFTGGTGGLTATQEILTWTVTAGQPSGGGGASGPSSIDAGGGAAGTFLADTNFSGGSTSSTTAAIDVSLIPSPVPPQQVYQTERIGPSIYTIGGFIPGTSHIVQLHFAEIFWSSAGQRQFNVIINGVQLLTNFDIIANTGTKNKAIEENFSVAADGGGQITIQFVPGAVDQPKISGIVIM